MHRELGIALSLYVNLSITLLLIYIRFNLFHIIFECRPEIVIILDGLFLVVIHDLT